MDKGHTITIYSNQLSAALKAFLYRIADDQMVIAHRNSEWTGLGPILEEDIAFSSIAQDKMGHSHAVYSILHEHFGEADPDTIAFTRDEKDFTCCHLVELPIGDYSFSLVRHLLFDLAEQLRFEMLENSSFEPLAKLARKVKGEIKYHVFHAVTWITQLGAKGNEESKARVQSALNETFPLALGIFEPGDGDEELKVASIFEGEDVLQKKWLEAVTSILNEAGLTLPSLNDVEPVYGGRKGYHTEYLQPMLTEMTEVFRIDASAEW
ncbi:MAG: phenylacetate-CoA oxygenase subunit PaaC [Ignavibacteriae bacterium]|nr:phenylacetate-CoA oxygenase subunit PaaC [Ignavibacteriota bacterium]MCB9216690.1 phenylacetate-CoA oxygenase subunit PaaC [Ignavibacteria bacterium]